MRRDPYAMKRSIETLEQLHGSGGVFFELSPVEQATDREHPERD